jgi:hypothetical protein
MATHSPSSHGRVVATARWTHALVAAQPLTDKRSQAKWKWAVERGAVLSAALQTRGRIEGVIVSTPHDCCGEGCNGRCGGLALLAWRSSATERRATRSTATTPSGERQWVGGGGCIEATAAARAPTPRRKQVDGQKRRNMVVHRATGRLGGGAHSGTVAAREPRAGCHRLDCAARASALAAVEACTALGA